MQTIHLKEIDSTDVSFLVEMTIESAFVSETLKEMWRSAATVPDFVAKYTRVWGREGDFGIVAITAEGEKVGAAWYRLFVQRERGDGVLAYPQIPELAIAIVPSYRGQGIGTRLMQELHEHARAEGFVKLMLSVDPANEPAIALYRKLGYIDYHTDDEACGTSVMMSYSLQGV